MIPLLKSTTPVGTPGDDPLAQFEAESASSIQGGPLAHPPVGAMPDAALDMSPPTVARFETLTLDTVLARRIPLFWTEAVAIVEATCTALLPAGGAELPAPDVSDILLTAAGAVQVRGGGSRRDSVQRLGRTLHTLTSGQAIPAPLRLFITKWIAADGAPSLREFASELAYFARPDGVQLIREVYRRCASAPAVDKRATSATPAQAGTEPPKTYKPARKATRRRVALAVAVVASSLVVAAAVLLYRSAQAGQGGSSDLFANLRARATEFGRSLGEVRTQVGDISAQLSAHLSSGADTAAGTPASTTAGAPPTTPTTSRDGVRPSQGGAAQPAAARRSPASRAPLAAASSSASVPALTGAEPTPSTPSAQPEAQPVEIASPPPAAVTATIAPNAIFSDADSGVNPPKMLYPQAPPPPLVFGSTDGVNVMEIIVGDDGDVERVKLISPPRRLTDMMLLSGAKMWKFAPASKDGQAVRYRIALSWSVNP
ncbi:MAG: hypothetical protein ACRD3C_23215 [Vicinamibacterales bacterium]